MKRLILIIGLLLVLVVGLSVNAQPAEAQQSVTWTSEFFNNPYLIGPAVLTRRDGAIAFNWGANSPGAGVPTDGFSARMATDVFFPAGTYRFNLLADDGAHLYVDFRSVMNTFERPRPGELVTADVTLPAGTYHIQVDYREVTGNAYIYLSWTNLATGVTTPSNAVTSLPQPAPVVGGGLWTAEYYNNPHLSGSPVVIIGETTPSHNWGAGAPFGNVPADNFSARWRSTQYLDAGSYQVSVRADDGVRVYVNGVLHINEWHNASGQTYTANVTLTPGYHTFLVEYYEAGGLAFLDYSLARLSAPPVYNPPPSAPVGGAAITVTTGMLNVRNAPDPVYGTILTKIRQGSTYPVVGRNANSSWWQINVNNTIGWVSASYVSAVNTQNVPVTSGGQTTPAPQPTGYVVTAIANVNLRGGPALQFSRLAVIPRGQTAQIVGRNAGNTWWQVNYNGTVGWVSASYALAQWNTNVGQIPVRS
jgi:uncharacterized protein YraI